MYDHVKGSIYVGHFVDLAAILGVDSVNESKQTILPNYSVLWQRDYGDIQ